MNKTLISDNRYFFSLYFLFLLAGAAILFQFSKEDIFLAINNLHFASGDIIFPIITHIGDGSVYVLMIVFLVFVKYRYAIMGALSFFFGSATALIMKHLIFDDALRPAKHFEHIANNIHYIEGVEIEFYHSFPSGHATTAFGMFCLLSLIIKRKWLGSLFFILALIAGYSRIYLSKHFFNDVYFGSIIGVAISVLVYYIVSKNKFVIPKKSHH